MRKMNGFTKSKAVVAAAMLSLAGLSACSSSQSSSSNSGHVLTVGTYKGHKGQFTTIQAAVNAAHEGDWILVAPGDYKESNDLAAAPTNVANGGFAGVLVTTSNLHIRGLSRSGVVIDGTKPGSSRCSSDAADQQFGQQVDGKAIGRNGIEVWKANNVSIDNLTACNFLGGGSQSGNEIWWNGGADSGQIGLHGYSGSYLTATSTYYGGDSTAATYGLFSSNAAGDGARWTHVYASNFNDAGMYVGACKRLCGITITDAWMEYSALGYSGTNSGGAIVIQNSRFDQNKDGFDTNTQINGDPPAPQDGACPGNTVSPITHTNSCWVLRNNIFEDNNNPNVPQAGNASLGPTGTGMTLSGGRNNTVMNNIFRNNSAWGLLVIPFPDSNDPEMGQSCSGTGGVVTPGFGCVYDPMNNVISGNTFENNGAFGNPTNGAIGQLALNANKPSNCFTNNHASGLAGALKALQSAYPVCGGNRAAPDAPGDLLAQVLCDTGFGSCPSGSTYPKTTQVVMHPLPSNLAEMPNPCAGVPDSAWCKGGHLI